MGNDSKKYLTPDETALFTGAAVQTLARWRCEGYGPQFIRVGRKIMYAVEDLVAWMNAGRVASTSESIKRDSITSSARAAA